MFCRHPERFSNVYEVLAETFQAMLPLFEAALGSIGERNPMPITYDPANWWESATDWAARTGNDADECDYDDRNFIEPALSRDFRQPQTTTPVSLRGRTLQVITKIATMSFTSGRTATEEPATLTKASDLQLTNPEDLRLGPDHRPLTHYEAAEVSDWREFEGAYIPREEGVYYMGVSEPKIFTETDAQGEEVVVFKSPQRRVATAQVVAVVDVQGAAVIVTKPAELKSTDPALLRKWGPEAPTPRASEDLVPLAADETAIMKNWLKGIHGYSANLAVVPHSAASPLNDETVELIRSTSIMTSMQLVAVVDDGAPKMGYDGG